MTKWLWLTLFIASVGIAIWIAQKKSPEVTKTPSRNEEPQEPQKELPQASGPLQPRSEDSQPTPLAPAAPNDSKLQPGPNGAPPPGEGFAAQPYEPPSFDSTNPPPQPFPDGEGFEGATPFSGENTLPPPDSEFTNTPPPPPDEEY